MFVEELETAKAKVNELQRQIAEESRRRQAVEGEKRLLGQRIYKLEEQLEASELAAQGAARKISDLQRSVEKVMLAEARANESSERADASEARSERLDRSLAESEEANRHLARLLSDMKQQLAERERDFEKAEALLAAFQARAAADAAIAAA